MAISLKQSELPLTWMRHLHDNNDTRKQTFQTLDLISLVFSIAVLMLYLILLCHKSKSNYNNKPDVANWPSTRLATLMAMANIIYTLALYMTSDRDIGLTKGLIWIQFAMPLISTLAVCCISFHLFLGIWVGSCHRRLINRITKWSEVACILFGCVLALPTFGLISIKQDDNGSSSTSRAVVANFNSHSPIFAMLFSGYVWELVVISICMVTSAVTVAYIALPPKHRARVFGGSVQGLLALPEMYPYRDTTIDRGVGVKNYSTNVGVWNLHNIRRPVPPLDNRDCIKFGDTFGSTAGFGKVETIEIESPFLDNSDTFAGVESTAVVITKEPRTPQPAAEAAVADITNMGNCSIEDRSVVLVFSQSQRPSFSNQTINNPPIPSSITPHSRTNCSYILLRLIIIYPLIQTVILRLPIILIYLTLNNTNPSTYDQTLFYTYISSTLQGVFLLLGFVLSPSFDSIWKSTKRLFR